MPIRSKRQRPDPHRMTQPRSRLKRNSAQLDSTSLPRLKCRSILALPSVGYKLGPDKTHCTAVKWPIVGNIWHRCGSAALVVDACRKQERSEKTSPGESAIRACLCVSGDREDHRQQRLAEPRVLDGKNVWAAIRQRMQITKTFHMEHGHWLRPWVGRRFGLFMPACSNRPHVRTTPKL